MPKETSHRKSEDNKSCLVPALFTGKAKLFLYQPTSKKETADSSQATSPYIGRGHRDSCQEKHTQPLGKEWASKARAHSGSVCSLK